MRHAVVRSTYDAFLLGEISKQVTTEKKGKKKNDILKEKNYNFDCVVFNVNFCYSNCCFTERERSD
jgi:hypothetical protein